MIIELRKKAQITIPKEIVSGLALAAGDALDIRLVDGVIRIEPVMVVRKTYVRAETRQPNSPTVPDKYSEGPAHAEEDTQFNADREPKK